MSNDYPERRRALVMRAMAAATENDPRIAMGPGRDRLDDEAKLAGLFNDLSHRPDRLHALLDPEPDGAEVAERVLSLRTTVGSGIDQERGTWDVYMLVRTPAPIDDAAIEALVRRHYAARAALLAELGRPDLSARLQAPVPFVHTARLEPKERREGLESETYEAIGDLLYDIEGDHPLFGLRKAAYTIAASYDLARWVLWPAYRRSVRADDPFRPAVELWAAGLQVHHRGNSIAVWSAR